MLATAACQPNGSIRIDNRGIASHINTARSSPVSGANVLDDGRNIRGNIIPGTAGISALF
jgi:hypothetical protein